MGINNYDEINSDKFFLTRKNVENRILIYLLTGWFIFMWLLEMCTTFIQVSVIQKRILDPLVLELQAIVCHLMWFCKMNLGPREEQEAL